MNLGHDNLQSSSNYQFREVDQAEFNENQININRDSHNEEEIMNEIIKEMGYDSKSILQQK